MQDSTYRSVKHLSALLIPTKLMLIPFFSFAQPRPIECKASFYADFFHGRKTANGEIFDQKMLTAAHKSLPFGTVLRVTNKENKQSVVVRINDRGPYVKGRSIDLSRAAASRIGIVRKGVGDVIIEPLNNDEPYLEYLANYAQREEEGELFTYADEFKNIVNPKMEQAVLPSEIETENSYVQPFNHASQDLSSQVAEVMPPPLPTDNLRYQPEGLFTIGKAIVYPDHHEGAKMANGESYISSNYVCAHNKYPIGSYLKVTRKSQPEYSVIVEVTDKSIGIMDYDIQLSWTAAADLDLFEAFDREVIVEEISVTHLDALPEPESAANTTGPQRSIEIAFYDGSASLSGESPLQVAESTKLEGKPVEEKNYPNLSTTKGLGLFKVEASRTPESGYGVQIAVVSQYREILDISDKLFRHGIQNTLVHSDVVGDKEVLRYIVGPFSSKDTAESVKNQLEDANIIGMIIRLEPLQ